MIPVREDSEVVIVYPVGTTLSIPLLTSWRVERQCQGTRLSSATSACRCRNGRGIDIENSDDFNPRLESKAWNINCSNLLNHKTTKNIRSTESEYSHSIKIERWFPNVDHISGSCARWIQWLKGKCLVISQPWMPEKIMTVLNVVVTEYSCKKKRFDK